MAVLNVKTKVGNLSVVGSGVVHLQGSNTFDIDINGYICTVRFLSDNGGPRYQGQNEGVSYVVNCYNHINTIGEAIFSPFPIGQLGGKSIFMTYYTTLLPSNVEVRRFEYSLWMES